MEIQLEAAEPHAIRSYSDQSILVAGNTVSTSCIISRDTLQTTWPIYSIDELTSDLLAPLLRDQPDVILIGHAGKPTLLSSIASELSKQKIGIESMPIGAACRTFNVLLSEHRAVVLGIILANAPPLPV